MTAKETGFRKPGRPRTEGAPTAVERATLHRQRVRASGGHEFTILLGPGAWRALQRLAPRGERGPLVERLLLAELARREREAGLRPVEVTVGTDVPSSSIDDPRLLVLAADQVLPVLAAEQVPPVLTPIRVGVRSIDGREWRFQYLKNADGWRDVPSRGYLLDAAQALFEENQAALMRGDVIPLALRDPRRPDMPEHAVSFRLQPR